MASVKSHTIWNMAGAGLPLLVGLIAIPILIDHIGVEAFGLLSIIWTLIGYFSLFDFGLGRALTQQISGMRHLNDKRQLFQFSFSGLAATLLLGIAGGSLLYFGANVLVYRFLNLSAGLQDDAYQALILAALAIPMVTLTSAFRGILEGFEDFRTSNLLRLLLGLLNFLVPVAVVLYWRADIVSVVWGLVAGRLLVMLLHILAMRLHLSYVSGALFLKRSHLHKLFSFGFWMTLSNLIGPLMVVADRFIISSLIGVSVVAYYTVPMDFAVRLLIIPAAIASALFPRLAFLHAGTSSDKGKALFGKSLKTTALIMGPVCLMLAAASYPGLKLWLGDDFASQSWPVLSVLAVGVFFNSLAHIPFAALQAVGRVRTTSLIHLGESLVYFPILLLLLHTHGIIGAAVAWSLRTLLDFITLHYFASRIHKSYAVV